MTDLLLDAALLLWGGGSPTGYTVETELVLDSVDRVAIAGAPRLLESGTLEGPEDPGPPGQGLVSPLKVEVFRLPDLDTPVAELDESFSRKWDDPANDTGAGELAVLTTDEALGDVVDGDVVRMSLYGEAAFEWVVEERDVVVRHEDPAEEVTKLAGRGKFSIFERAVVYPANGIAAKPIERDRVFDWTSRVFDDSAWTEPKLITPTSAWADQTPEWPDGAAYGWLWAHAGNGDDAPPGFVYFRREFTVSGASEMIGYVDGDNEAEVFIDGQHVATSKYPEVTVFKVEVTPGDHLLAVRGLNYPKPADTVSVEVLPYTHTVTAGPPRDTLWGLALRFYDDGRFWRRIFDANAALIQADAETAGLWNPRDPGHWIFPGQVLTIPGLSVVVGSVFLNPGGLLLALYPLANGAASGASFADTSSSSGWKHLAYPADPPGMTVGEVLLAVTEEWRLRAGLNIEATFTGRTDSKGQPWTASVDIATKTGTDLLTFLKELAGTYCDLWLETGSLRLHAWRKGTRGIRPGLELHGPTDDTDPDSGNIDAYTTRSQ